MYTTIKNRFLPYFGVLDSGKIALVVASVMGGYVLLLNNSPCIDAQSTCQIGSTNEFTGNISIAGGTSYKGTLDASNLTNDRTYTFPDQDGTFLMGSAFTGNKMIGTSSTGSLETVDTYPKTFGGVTDANKYVTLNGAGTEIIANSPTIPLADISLTGGSANALMGIDSTNATVEYKLLSTIPLEGFDTSSATVGQFLKAGASTGVWGNIDPTVDLSVGSGTALQEIRVNAGGTALEYFTPSGGSDVTKVASGNIIMNSAFGALPQSGANICWFTQAGTLDDTKSYKLVVNFKLNENQSIANNNNQTRRGYINTLFKQSWATDCGDTTNNNNGANYTFWSMTQNMPTDISPNNTSFGYINGYAETSGLQYEDCCVPFLPYAYNSSSSGVNGSHISANQLIVEFSPAQDSVLSSGYKVGVTGTYKSNGLIAGNYNNPTYNNFGAWQVMGNFTNPGATQNNTNASAELKFEDFQGFKVGCSTNQCFGGDSTWALYEFSN